MSQIHPHAEATYRMIELDDGKPAIEVIIPGSHPTRVTGFETQAEADAWIERHRKQVATGTIARAPVWSRRPAPKPAS